MATFNLTVKLSKPDALNSSYRPYPEQAPFPRNGSVTAGRSIHPDEVNTRIPGDFDIVAHSLIKSKDGITTFRAVLNKSIDVVVKFALGEEPVSRLIAQAQYYRNELKALQGSHIPILYGVFSGNTRAPRPRSGAGKKNDITKQTSGGKGTAEFRCMVLEDCGVSLYQSEKLIQDLCEPELQRVMVVLGQFHLLKLTSPDPIDEDDPYDIISEEHILRNKRDKNFRTIGFHELVRHNCKFTKWYFHEPYRPHFNFGCNDLLVTGLDFGVWDRINGKTVLIGGREIPDEGNFPQQKTINILVESWTVKPINLSHLMEWLKAVEIWRRSELENDNVQDWDDIRVYAERIMPEFDETGVTSEV